MKRFLAYAVLVGLLGLAASPVRALECQISVVIPERFAIAMCPNVDPATKFDEKETIKSTNTLRENNKVEKMATVFYAPNKKPGDGLLAVAFSGYDTDDPSSGFLRIARDEVHGKKLEKFVAYEIGPGELWQIYDDNEVVADEDFKGKPIMFEVKCTGLAKDATGKPYIKVPVDDIGLKGLQIYLSKDDPFLRKLKKGQTLGIRAYPKRYLMQTVMLDGEVIDIYEPESKGKKK